MNRQERINKMQSLYRHLLKENNLDAHWYTDFDGRTILYIKHDKINLTISIGLTEYDLKLKIGALQNYVVEEYMGVIKHDLLNL